MQTTPRTGCHKVAKLLCAAAGCRVVEGEVECRLAPRSILVDSPQEQCDIAPIRVCRPATRLVPRLVPVKTCMDRPKARRCFIPQH